jgi:hypothetical protein|uniref:Uncharacterized protein n=1 Tax=Siphoviridae sp. cteLh2 TaxID=2825590 RepID=A0A8S5U5Z4_9CAUD|nr:hypothetical protein [uncultured Lachnoclostridium sp.]DAF89879.1 MAG TPA: hypothetical protein [Siphoviridae sp. cteLh2]
MSDLNNRLTGTKSNKLNKSSLIVALFCETLDNSQDIKRLLYYHSLNPLSPMGKYYDGKMKPQSNIEFSLLEDAVDRKRLIFDEVFDPLMTTEESYSIYITDVGGRFGRSVGDIGIEVNIVIPVKDNVLMGLGNKRTHQIGALIADLFDEVTVDKKSFPDYVYDLGNIQFSLTDYVYGRVAQKSNMVCLNMQFEVKKITIR